VTRLCALYGVARAGYYAWRRRGPSARKRQDGTLLEQIQAIFTRSRDTYGSPRIHHALATAGVRVSVRRVARLMRAAGLRARARKIYRRLPGLHGFFTSIPNRQLDRLTTTPGPGVGRGHHLSESGGGLAVPRSPDGSALTPHHRLEPRGDQRCSPHAGRPPPRRPQPAATVRRHLPQRSRRRVRPPMPSAIGWRRSASSRA